MSCIDKSVKAMPIFWALTVGKVKNEGVHTSVCVKHMVLAQVCSVQIYDVTVNFFSVLTQLYV